MSFIAFDMKAIIEINLESSEQLTMRQVSKIKEMAESKGRGFSDVLTELVRKGLEVDRKENQNEEAA